MNPIIKSVVNHYKWTPQEVDELYCDDIDFKGLIYWYNEVKDIVSKSKQK